MINFPDPNTTPNRAFECEKCLDSEGVERERQVEVFDGGLSDLLYDFLYKTPCNE